MEKARLLEEEDDFDHDEALRSALAHRKYLLYRLIPSDIESEDDTDDEEEYNNKQDPAGKQIENRY